IVAGDAGTGEATALTVSGTSSNKVAIDNNALFSNGGQNGSFGMNITSPAFSPDLLSVRNNAFWIIPPIPSLGGGGFGEIAGGLTLAQFEAEDSTRRKGNLPSASLGFTDA